MKAYNFVDVFAGAGGLSCGLEQSKFKCILGIEHDKHAAATFAKNHHYAEVFCGNVENLTETKLLELTKNQKVTAVVGGPPCQGFSTVGKGNPNDKRNSLFLHFVRIVKVLNPDFIIVENVTGLLATKNEKTLKAILNEFTQLGYDLDFKVVSADDYGVPEKRRRTIILGSKITKVIFPQKRKGKKATVGEAFLDLKTKKGDILNHDLQSAKISCKIDVQRLQNIPEGKGIRYQKDEELYLPKNLKLDVDWENIREGRLRQTKYQRLDRSLASPTIMTNRHTYYHPTEHRFLTPREAAKLQSFPNHFEFLGPVSAQWKQIGNAVPPLLGKALGEAILEMLANTHKKSTTQEKLSTSKAKKIPSIRKDAFIYKRPSEQSL